MASIALTMTVRRPLWLRMAWSMAVLAYRVRSWVAGSAPTDAEIERLVDWYGRHLKVEAR